MSDRQNFGRWLARLRAQAGISQPKLGAALSKRLERKFSHSNIAAWELGLRMQNADVIPALASELGVTIEELLKVRHTAKGYIPLADDELPQKRF